MSTVPVPGVEFIQDVASDGRDGLLATANGGLLLRLDLQGGVTVLVEDERPGGGPETPAVDAAGRVYFHDGRQVRRLDPVTGRSSVVAGNGIRTGDWPTSGDGGLAIDAALGMITSVAVGTDGDLYVAQRGEFADGHRIRRIDAVTGIIETVAGPGTPVEAHPRVPETNARITFPGHLRFDRDGTLLFTDEHGRIMRLDPTTRRVRVVAGSTTGNSGDGGPAIEARFELVSGLAVDSEGHIFVADYTSNRVRRIDRDTGLVHTIAGNGQRVGGDGYTEFWASGAPPDDETCQNDPVPPQLRVTVADSAGTLSGTKLHVLDWKNSNAPGSSLVTDDSGAAVITPARSGDYVVTAVRAGFRSGQHPSSRARARSGKRPTSTSNIKNSMKRIGHGLGSEKSTNSGRSPYCTPEPHGRADPAGSVGTRRPTP